MKRAALTFALILSLFLIIASVGASEIMGNDYPNELDDAYQSTDDSIVAASEDELDNPAVIPGEDQLDDEGSDGDIDTDSSFDSYESTGSCCSSESTDSTDSTDSEGSADCCCSCSSDDDSSFVFTYSATSGTADSDDSLVSPGKTQPTKFLSSNPSSKLVPYRFTYAKDISSVYGKKVNFYVKVLNKQGKGINHVLVTFKASNKVYLAFTNKNGIARITLNYYAGNYTIRYYAGEISGKKKYTVRNYYKITNYKWNSGANVLKNKRIRDNVPNSALVRKMIKLAKSGTPVIEFKGGPGKVVFITAGCHGNEIPSQVAAMKLIKYLQNHPIKGTVYVMPFMNPKGTAANVRDYKGYHLNKNANKKGSISYKTVKLITKFKCNAYGDFHATKPGGKPGKDAVMGTYKPTKKSAAMAKYISKNAKVKCVIYKKAGTEYPGALEDEVNIKGIPAVTCEVISPHGKIKKGSTTKALLMMKTLLKYNKVI